MRNALLAAMMAAGLAFHQGEAIASCWDRSDCLTRMSEVMRTAYNGLPSGDFTHVYGGNPDNSLMLYFHWQDREEREGHVEMNLNLSSNDARIIGFDNQTNDEIFNSEFGDLIFNPETGKITGIAKTTSDGSNLNVKARVHDVESGVSGIFFNGDLGGGFIAEKSGVIPNGEETTTAETVNLPSGRHGYIGDLNVDGIKGDNYLYLTADFDSALIDYLYGHVIELKPGAGSASAIFNMPDKLPIDMETGKFNGQIITYGSFVKGISETAELNGQFRTDGKSAFGSIESTVYQGNFDVNHFYCFDGACPK